MNPQGSQGMADFSAVQQREQQFTATRRTAAKFANDQHAADSVGLCLSGGGIRSASFALGVIQGLRKSGILRYVDFLSGVSGGSYASALLTTSFCASKGAPARPLKKREERDRLDIDLNKDDTQPPRMRTLSQNGRYLIKPVEYWNRFLSGWFLLLIHVFSGMLALSAVIAFVWRMMDSFAVRDYLSAIGFEGDVWPAVLPLVALTILWTLFWSLSRWKFHESARGRIAKAILIAMIVWALATVAGLVGNGDVTFAAGWDAAPGHLKPILFFVILLGLLPALFRSRLVHSGRTEAGLLERGIYRYSLSAVVIGLPLLLIGFFARENVSGFGTARDGRLLSGDVKDIVALSNWLDTSEHRDLDGIQADADKEEEAVNIWRPKAADSELHAASATVEALAADLRRLAGVSHKLREQVLGASSWHPIDTGQVAVHAVATDDGEIAIDMRPAGTVEGDSSLYSEAPIPIGSLEDWRAITPYEPSLVFTGEHQDNVALTAASWLHWKYESYCTWLRHVVAHAVSTSSSDPITLQLRCAKLQRDREARLLAILNERVLTSRHFADLPTFQNAFAVFRQESEAPSTETATVPLVRIKDTPGLAELVRRRDQLGMKSFTPDEVLELNRLLLEAFFPQWVRSRTEIRRTTVIHADQFHRLLCAGMLGLVFIVSGALTNPNSTSVQRYYQERLAEAYLNGDDTPLSGIESRLKGAPLPIICGSANFRIHPNTPDQQPAAERVGEFEFSPFYCGSQELGYRETEKYYGGNLRLADAIAISGAAVNPVYFDRWELFVVFGLLNLRLGQWLPTPRGNVSRRPSFLGLLWNMALFVTGRAKDRRYVLITDGGHFDNLGLYALLKRRCKVVVVCDASCDPDCRMDELCGLLGRLQRVDGVTLFQLDGLHELDFRELLLARNESGTDKASHSFGGLIRYPADEAGNHGWGLFAYLRPSLNGDESPFVWNHAQNDSDFPFDPTIEQAFSAAQFWAYLDLGKHIGDDLCRADTGQTKEERELLSRVANAEDRNLRDLVTLLLSREDNARKASVLRMLFNEPEPPLKDARSLHRRLAAAIAAEDWETVQASLYNANISDGMIRSDRVSGRKLLATLRDGLVATADLTCDSAISARTEMITCFAEVVHELHAERDDVNRVLAKYLSACFADPRHSKAASHFLSHLYFDRAICEWLTSERDGVNSSFIVAVLQGLSESQLIGWNDQYELLLRHTKHRMKEVREAASSILARIEPHPII